MNIYLKPIISLPGVEEPRAKAQKDVFLSLKQLNIQTQKIKQTEILQRFSAKGQTVSVLGFVGKQSLLELLNFALVA